MGQMQQTSTSKMSIPGTSANYNVVYLGNFIVKTSRNHLKCEPRLLKTPRIIGITLPQKVIEAYISSSRVTWVERERFRSIQMMMVMPMMIMVMIMIMARRAADLGSMLRVIPG